MKANMESYKIKGNLTFTYEALDAIHQTTER